MEYGSSDEQTFINLTGCSKAEAAQFLDACGYDLQQAIEMFFASFSDKLGVSTSKSLPTSHRSSQKHFGDEDDVRAPDAVKRQRLLDTTDILPTPHQRIASMAPTAAFARGSGPISEKEATLSRLYRPPVDHICPGTFAEVRNKSRLLEKWILTNLQTEDEFSCHVLNRDVWSDDTVQEILRCSFVFWQTQLVSAEGHAYAQRHSVGPLGLPHVAVIDPRTGGIVRRWDGPDIANISLMEKLLNFLNDNPSPSGSGDAGAEGHTRSTSTSSSSTTTVSARKSDNSTSSGSISSISDRVHSSAFDVFDLTQDSTTTTSDVSTSKQSRDTEVLIDVSSTPAPPRGFLVTKDVDVDAGIDVADSTGTGAGSNCVKVQLRLPQTEGREGPAKCVISLLPHTPLRTIVNRICRQMDKSLCGRRFDAVFGFPSQSLFELLETKDGPELTVEAAGLVGGTLSVRLLE